MPAERVGQDAAEQDAEAAAAGHDEAEDAHRLRALRGLGEQVHHQRERHCRDDRAAEALDRPRRDQEPLRRGQPAGDRGDGEERDPDEEHPAVAEQIAEPAAEEEKAAEGEEIGVHDPGQRGLGEAQIRPDRRQRHVHDRGVQDDHQIAEAENDQREPACASIQGHGPSSFRCSNGLEGLDRPAPRKSSVTVPMSFPTLRSLGPDGRLRGANDRFRPFCPYRSHRSAAAL